MSITKVTGEALQGAWTRPAARAILRLLVLSGSLLAFLAAPSAMAETRIALVIGNAAYHHAPHLANPGNDASGVAAALRRLKFQVEEALDLDRTGMELALRNFAQKLEDADVAVFFYAGHALQVRGKNYLVPVEVKLEKESDLIFETVDLELVLRLLEEEPRTSIVFLDACRDNPLARSLARGVGRTRSQMIGRGLAGVESGIGTLIAYATQPDNVALDGTGQNSPFTAALLENIETPGIEIRQMLNRVRRAVIDRTQRRQVPWDYSSLTDDFYFQPAALQAKDPQPTPEPTETSNVYGSDVVVWSIIQGSASVTDFETFLAKYPQSPFAPFAQARLAALTPKPGASGLSVTPGGAVDPPQAGSAGAQGSGAGGDQGVATMAKAVSGPPGAGGEEPDTGAPSDAALAAESAEAPSSGPASKPQQVEAQAASDGAQTSGAGAGEVAATEAKAVSGPLGGGGEEPDTGAPSDAALAAESAEAPSSGPASKAEPVDTPSVQAARRSGLQEADTAALTGQSSAAGTSSTPYTVEQARAVEQSLGLSRDDWREVQHALNELNHPAGPEDGLPGRQTRAALEAWQAAMGGRPTGHLTAAQHTRLLEEAAPEALAMTTFGMPPAAEAAPDVAALTPDPKREVVAAPDVAPEAMRGMTPTAEAVPEMAAVISDPIPSAEGELINECDRLAGQPSDPGHVGAGVEWQDLQPEPALVACALAMKEQPDEVRFQYQYGRALLRVGLIEDARLWFRSTAEQGYVAAQRNIGHLYMRGVGVPLDEGEALSWYRRAAEQSDPNSQYLLGLMYAGGIGVPRDDVEAATWLRMAAEQGEEGAQFILGWMYRHGRGVPKDLARAAALYRDAAAQGNQVAWWALQRLN